MATEQFPDLTVYVRLLDEGTDVWRPTRAVALVDGLYRILPTSDYDPDGEHWEFPPGSLVLLEERSMAHGQHLVATQASK